MKRISYLDGLRGIACLTVVIDHYVNAFAPGAVDRLGFLTNGESAVYVFFLISGFVLTGSFSNAESGAWTLAARRLLRLAAPVWCALLISMPLALFQCSACRDSGVGVRFDMALACCPQYGLTQYRG